MENLKELWDYQFKELQELNAFLYLYPRDRRFYLYKGGVPLTYHLGEKDYRGLHLIGASARQITEFLETHAPQMFRFYSQSEGCRWMHKLRAEWFYPEAVSSRIAYDEQMISYAWTSKYINCLPTYGGVYVVTEELSEINLEPGEDPLILYVGSAKNIRNRWKTHHRLKEIIEKHDYFRLHCFNRQFFMYDLKRMEVLIARRLKPIYSKRIG